MGPHAPAPLRIPRLALRLCLAAYVALLAYQTLFFIALLLRERADHISTFAFAYPVAAFGLLVASLAVAVPVVGWLCLVRAAPAPPHPRRAMRGPALAAMIEALLAGRAAAGPALPLAFTLPVGGDTVLHLGALSLLIGAALGLFAAAGGISPQPA